MRKHTELRESNNVYSFSQASTLTKKVTGPVGPVTPRIFWSCKKYTGPTIFSF